MPYIAQVALGKKPSLTIYGGDYETSDGTGIFSKLKLNFFFHDYVYFFRHKRLCTCNGFSRRTRGSLKKITIKSLKVTSNCVDDNICTIYLHIIMIIFLVKNLKKSRI